MPALRCSFESDGATKKRDCPPRDRARDGTDATQQEAGATVHGPTACVPGCTPTMVAGWEALGETYWCSAPPPAPPPTTGAHGGSGSGGSGSGGSSSTPPASVDELVSRDFSCPWRPTALPSMLASWAARRAANVTDCSARCAARRAGMSADELARFDAARARFYSEAVLDRSSVLQAMPHSVEALFYIGGVTEEACTAQQKVAPGDHLHSSRCDAFTRAARDAAQRAFGVHVPLLQLNLRDAHTPFALAL
jgi:hypothetical protein